MTSPRPSVPAEVPIELIVAGQNVRADLGDLTSMETTAQQPGVGIFDPVGLVELEDGRYKMVYGFRRFAVALRLGMRTIPAVLLPEGARIEIINLVENTKRKDLTPLEEADGLRQLQLRIGSADEVGALVGLSGSTVRDRLALLGTHESVREVVQAGTLTSSAATELSRLPVADQPAWIKKARRMSVRALRESIDFQLATPEERERRGAEELARQAGHAPQVELPTIAAEIDDPRLLLALEYARRAADHVAAIHSLWPQLPDSLKVEVVQVLQRSAAQITTLMVAVNA